MHNNTQRHCLSKMRIVPWVSRRVEYICVLNAPITSPQSALLARLLQALEWPPEEGITLLFPQQAAKIAALQPQFVLVFGSAVPECAPCAQIITLPSLEALLTDRAAKKQAWDLLAPSRNLFKR